MTQIPSITVQLVHIQGPLKGEIQEFSSTEIRIGRHPECQVRFPKDQVTLSRQHARILREGNRFKIVDESTNGTFVNGKRVAEAYLKDGDVITFAEDGPKVSFLTQVSQEPVIEAAPPQTAPSTSPPPAQPATPIPPTPAQPAAPPPVQPAAAPPVSPMATPQASVSEVPIEPVSVPFAIQFGPALRSYQKLPIVLGSGSGCDFVIAHSAIRDQHAQIFFARDQYWIKDLTGQSLISLNEQPVTVQAPLQPDMRIALSPQGPKFRFLGGGRLAEIEDPLPQPAPRQSAPPAQPPADTDAANPSVGKKTGSLFKKFFS